MDRTFFNDTLIVTSPKHTSPCPVFQKLPLCASTQALIIFSTISKLPSSIYLKWTDNVWWVKPSIIHAGELEPESQSLETSLSSAPKPTALHDCSFYLRQVLPSLSLLTWFMTLPYLEQSICCPCKFSARTWQRSFPRQGSYQPS